MNFIKKIWNSLDLRMDEAECNLFEKFFVITMRTFSTNASKLFKKSKITPNQITASRIVFYPPMFYFFYQGTYLGNILGLICILLYSMLDAIDGDLAKLKGMISELGGWLDHNLDKIMVFTVLTAIILGSYNITQNKIYFFVGFIVLFSQAMIVNFSSEFTNTFGENIIFDPTLIKAVDDNKKASLLDKILVNAFVFHNFWPYFIFTLRYHILIGTIFGIMRYMVFYWAVILSIRWILMFLLYLAFLGKGKSRFILINELKKRKITQNEK